MAKGLMILRSFEQVKIDIGGNIRFKRKELKISQKDLAQASGISNSFLCDIEKGRQMVSLKVLNNIAHELNTEISSFFT
jgi:transcriptional regulator with XRE-family HTH domain